MVQGEIVLELTGNVWLSQEKIKDHPAYVWGMDGLAGVRVHMKQREMTSLHMYTEVNMCTHEIVHVCVCICVCMCVCAYVCACVFVREKLVCVCAPV